MAAKVEPRWLTDDEQATWRALLTVWPRLFRRLDDELQRDAGIPHAYYPILISLSEAPHTTVRMSELADCLGSSRSRLSHAIAKLEEAGLVQRLNCPTDRRGALAQLTDQGLAAVKAAAPGHVAAVRRHLFDHLTPEQQVSLRAACEAVIAHLENDS